MCFEDTTIHLFFLPLHSLFFPFSFPFLDLFFPTLCPSPLSHLFSSTVGYNVPEVIRLRCQECQDHMKERPQVKQELHELTQSVRLSERKYRLVEGLIADSEAQCESLQREIGSLNAKLKFDANKDGVSFCFVVFCFLFALFIDLLTDTVQPLSS